MLAGCSRGDGCNPVFPKHRPTRAVPLNPTTMNCLRSSLQSKSRLPHPARSPWEIERATRLHRLFTRVEFIRELGISVNDGLRKFAWFWRGRTFRSDPSKRVPFSRQTLRALFYKWRRGGRVPSALYHRWHQSSPKVPAPLVCRFIEFAARNSFPGLRAAWREFSDFRLRRQRNSPKIGDEFSYGQMLRCFSAADFRALQTLRATQERAHVELNRLRLGLIAAVRRQLPDRPVRRRRTPAEISLEASEL